MSATPPAIHDPAHWDSVAASYAAEADRMTARYAQAAWDLAALPHSARVLDVATGAGALLIAALQGGADAVGIDFSPAMVALAQARAAALRPGTHAQVMDGQRLDFADHGFDAAFSIFGVFMFPDPAAGFAEMARVLCPGGTAIVAVWENPGGAGPAELFAQAATRLFPDKPLPLPVTRLFNTPDLLDAAFAEAGLVPHATHRVTFAWPAPPVDWFRNHARLAYGWSPLWQALGDDERAAFAEEAARLATALPPDGVHSTALVGLARKRG